MRRALLSIVLVPALSIACASVPAQALEDDGGASWRLEQPTPPPPPVGVPGASTPIGLGRVGDVEFAPGMPNRGALITAGNPPTVPAGVWEYDGVAWRELSTVCGASDGRIVWAGPEEFWAISDGRPGAAGVRGISPPTRDNTLCRFSNPGHDGEPLRVMESFAAPAFEASSYQAMNAGACISSSDCWFAGEPLPAESIEAGSFHLHWNGATLTEQPYPAEGHAVGSMQSYEGQLYEGVRITSRDRVEASTEPAPVHVIEPEGATQPFEAITEVPLYEVGEFASSLDFLHLGASEGILWGATGSQAGSAKPGQVTIVRLAGGGWRQIVGPEASELSGVEPFPRETVTSIAVEPGGESAWIGLDSPSDYAAASSEKGEPSLTAPAKLARVLVNGEISPEDEATLPDEAEVGGKGAALAIACPAAHDCWMASTAGWLFHLATDQERAEMQAGTNRDTDPAFETLITERPPDKGLPPVVPVTLPPDDSGLLGELAGALTVPQEHTVKPEQTHATVPLLSKLHAKLIHGSTLDLSFHLAAKARLKLIARRHRAIVAATHERTYAAGNRSLQLRLNPRRWPTKLQLRSHALAPLPTVSLTQSSETTVSTSLEFPDFGSRALTGILP